MHAVRGALRRVWCGGSPGSYIESQYHMDQSIHTHPSCTCAAAFRSSRVVRLICDLLHGFYKNANANQCVALGIGIMISI